MECVVLNIAKPTFNDPHFYTRWEDVGLLATPALIPELVTVLVCDQHTDVTQEFLNNYPNLKYICSATTGHTHLKFNQSKYYVLTLRGHREFLKTIRSVSEYTIHRMLNMFKYDSQSAAGKTLGIIGYGRIGRHVGELAQALKMNVLTFDVDSAPEKIESIFRVADVITIHLEENEATRGMINERLISFMPHGSYFINTSRASIVDEKALAGAQDKLAGICLDVWENRDLFKPLSTVTITNHIAGSSKEDRIKTDVFIIEKLKDLILLHSSRPSQLPLSPEKSSSRPETSTPPGPTQA